MTSVPGPAPPSLADGALPRCGAAAPVARQHLVALAVLLVVTVGFFAPYLFQGRVFLAADTLSAYLPWSAYAPPGFQPKNSLITDPVNANWAGLYNEQLKSGGLQHWNPWLLTGLPSTGVTAMSGGAPGRYYPLKLLLHRWLPPAHAFMWLLIVHLYLAGAFQYAYLREIGAGLGGALFGGVAFMLNGYAMVWLEFESVAAVAACLPLLLLIMERYRLRPLRSSLLGALALGTVALSGQIQYLIYLALLLVIYEGFLLVRSWRERRDPRELRTLLLAFLGTCALGALIGAVELLPSFDLIRHSSRIARTFTFATFFETLGRVPWRYFVTLLFPDFFGSPVLGFNLIPRLASQEYMNYNELCIYVGVPSLFLLPALALRPRRPHAALYLGLIALLALLLAGTVLYYPFFALVPGMDRMNPTRLIFLFAFAAASAAGLGLDGLADLSRRRRVLYSLLAAGLLGGGLLLAQASGTSRSLTVWFNSEVLQGPNATDAVARLLQLRSWSSAAVLKPALLAAATAALLMVHLWWRSRAARLASFALLVVLLAYDLGSFGRGYNAVVEPRQIYPRTPAIDFLAAQPGPFRVVLDVRRRFQFNSLAPFGIQEVGGYSSFYPDGAGRFLSFVEDPDAAARGWRFDRWVAFRNVNAPLLNLANAKYVLTAPWATSTDPRLRLVYRQEVAIFENTASLPRAFAVHRARAIGGSTEALRALGSPGFDPGREVVLERAPDTGFLAGVRESGADSVTIERYEPDRVAVRADLGASGWLVLADAWDAGWGAEVDGRPAPIERADVAFRAVALSAGSHRVVFTYVARAFRIGLMVTLAALAVVAGGIAWDARRRRVPGPPAAGADAP